MPVDFEVKKEISVSEAIMFLHIVDGETRSRDYGPGLAAVADLILRLARNEHDKSPG